jgi:GntR family transcriptional repressor for pyruvate dehydrogenase complex
MELDVKRTTLPDSLAQQIKTLIIERKLMPGDRLPSQRALAEQYGVGRPTIREAFHRLAEMGLVSIRHGQGATVLNPTAESLAERVVPLLAMTEPDVLTLLEAKRIIETKCAELAAVRATDQDIEELYKWLQEMEETAEDPIRHAEADYFFHLTIVKAVRNPVMNEVIKFVGKMFYGALTKTAILAGREIAMDFHRRIYEAIKKRDPEAASRLLQEHITETMERVKRSGAFRSGEKASAEEE